MKTKTILLTLAAMLLPLVSFAQESELPTATLKVDDQTTIFSGPGSYIQALKAANEASISGKSAVITLSSGTFDGTEDRIRSNISIYGMGWHDEEDGIKETYIRSRMMLGTTNANVGTTDNVHIEGVHINGNIVMNEDGFNNIKIFRCRFGDITFWSKTNNLIVRNCWFAATSSYDWRGVHTNMLIQNCVMSRPYYWNAATESIFDHCIINYDGGIDRSYYSNCIMYYGCSDGGTENNCVLFNRTGLPSGVSGSGNYFSVDQSTFWADGSTNLSWNADRLWELRTPDDYPGTDGTQVGVYGGDYPYNRIPTTPRIFKSEIDTKTSAEGKLKLHIEAQAQPVVE